MDTVARSVSRARQRERSASPDELAEDLRRIRAAKPNLLSPTAISPTLRITAGKNGVAPLRAVQAGPVRKKRPVLDVQAKAAAMWKEGR